jgi:hypothetical protein
MRLLAHSRWFVEQSRGYVGAAPLHEWIVAYFRFLWRSRRDWFW